MYYVFDCDLYFIFGHFNDNVLPTVRGYSRRYPSRRPTNGNVMCRLHDRLRNTGSIYPTNNLNDVGERTHGRLSPLQKNAILWREEESPELSTRILARKNNASSNTMWKLL
ncbi:uncharacterized protein TNCV_662331 [Trichonephila clavipes]|nr:uncharacterized protein TNCV_662331 [Trichonephila clavipes]